VRPVSVAPGPSVAVEADKTEEGIFGDDGEHLALKNGERVLRGYFYSLRRRADRLYQLWDPAYAETVSASQRARMFAGWPLVHFRYSMVLHAGFHMTPTASYTSVRQRWYELDSHDRDVAHAALGSTDE